MRSVFATCFVVLALLSGVAFIWQPTTAHTRLTRIRFLFAPADKSGNHAFSRTELKGLFAALDANHDGAISYADFPDSIRGRVPEALRTDAGLPRAFSVAYLGAAEHAFQGSRTLRAFLNQRTENVVPLRDLPAGLEKDKAEIETFMSRMRGLLTLAALKPYFKDNEAAIQEMETIQDRLWAPKDADYSAYLERTEGGWSPDVATSDRMERVLLVLYETDLNDDFKVSATDWTGYFDRLDLDHDDELTAKDLPEAPYKLVWASDNGPMRVAQVGLFNRRYPQEHLILDPPTGGMEKNIVQCLAGVGPDLFDSATPFTLAAYVRSGIAMDITDQMAAKGITPDTLWPSVKPFYMLEGRMYGHPRNAGAPAIWINKDIFDAAGIPYPTGDWDWDQFVKLAQRLTKRGKSGKPIQFGFVSVWDLSIYFPMSFLRQWGASPFNAAGTRCTLDTPQAAKALQFAQDLMYKYRIMPTPSDETAMANMGGWGQGAVTLFGGGKGAMAMGYRWWLAVLRKPDFAHLRLGAVPMPRGPSGEIEASAGAVCINKQSHNLPGALAFVEYLHSKAYNELVDRQADSLGPVVKYQYGPYEEQFMHNPDYPREDYNAVWRDALARAKPPVVSPYVNGQLVERILVKYFDLIKYRGSSKSIAEILKEATRAVNGAIVDQLRNDPALKKKYMEAVKKGARPAWDNPKDAP